MRKTRPSRRVRRRAALARFVLAGVVLTLLIAKALRV